jgi:predicted nucleic acid-binding protein
MATGLAVSDTSLVLDNDVFTHWRKGQPYVMKEIAGYIKRHKQPPALTSTTLFEAMWGIESSEIKGDITEAEAGEYRSKVEALIQGCVILPFDQNAAITAAYMFARLSQSDRNKHWGDLFTAATALAHRHGVATRNRKDFELLGKHLPNSNPLLRLAIWKP